MAKAREWGALLPDAVRFFVAVLAGVGADKVAVGLLERMRQRTNAQPAEPQVLELALVGGHQGDHLRRGGEARVERHPLVAQRLLGIVEHAQHDGVHAFFAHHDQFRAALADLLGLVRRLGAAPSEQITRSKSGYFLARLDRLLVGRLGQQDQIVGPPSSAGARPPSIASRERSSSDRGCRPVASM